jgi:hypothetical protein
MNGDLKDMQAAISEAKKKSLDGGYSHRFCAGAGRGHYLRGGQYIWHFANIWFRRVA